MLKFHFSHYSELVWVVDIRFFKCLSLEGILKISIGFFSIWLQILNQRTQTMKGFEWNLFIYKFDRIVKERKYSKMQETKLLMKQYLAPKSNTNESISILKYVYFRIIGLFLWRKIKVQKFIFERVIPTETTLTFRFSTSPWNLKMKEEISFWNNLILQ